MNDNRGREKTSLDSEPPVGIRSLLNRFVGWFHTSSPDSQHIDYFVNTVEPKLKYVKGYRDRLHEPLRICREHCRSMIAEIPGPIPLKNSPYSEDPLIKAAFTGSDQINELLKHAAKTASQTPLPGSSRVALLTMTSTEKTIFGRKKQGNMIIGDTAMRAVNFTDHNLVGVATTLENSKEALEKYSFEIIAEATARELSEIRTKLVDLRQRQEWLRAMSKMFGSEKKAGMGCVFVPFDPEKEAKQKKLEQMLMENKSEIAAASSKSETPENWLTIVENFLSSPEDILNMRLVTLRLDWSNVLTNDPEEKANTLTFSTFTLADEMQREGVLVAFEQE